MATEYHPGIADAIREYLDEEGWEYDFVESRGAFRFPLRLNDSQVTIHYFIIVHSSDFVVYAVFPAKPDRTDGLTMRRLAGYVAQANYGLLEGNFELDLRDGEIRYKCYVNCGGTFPARGMIRSSICCPAMMFRRYGYGLMLIMFHGFSDTDAIFLCEGLPFEKTDDGGRLLPSVEMALMAELMRKTRDRRGFPHDAASPREE